MRWLQNWWRGWSDDDLQSALRKVAENYTPHSISWLTSAEMRALVANPVHDRQPWTVDRDGRVRTANERPVVFRAAKPT